jgi:hypothetical protein
MGEEHRKFWLENLKVIDHVENLGVGGKIILKWSFEKDDRCGLDSSGL